jgi:hypothetical protein
VAKYYPPDGGKAIQDSGVTPAVAVADTEPQIEFDDNGEPITPAQDQAPAQKTENDPVVKKAIDVLK